MCLSLKALIPGAKVLYSVERFADSYEDRIYNNSVVVNLNMV